MREKYQRDSNRDLVCSIVIDFRPATEPHSDADSFSIVSISFKFLTELIVVLLEMLLMETDS